MGHLGGKVQGNNSAGSTTGVVKVGGCVWSDYSFCCRMCWNATGPEARELVLVCVG